MLKKMSVRNLTAFSKADFSFAPNLNVIVGENATGKTHILKIAYSMLAVSAEQGRKSAAATPPISKSALEVRLADKLSGVFRPERLGHLVRREAQRCEISMDFDDPGMNIGLHLRRNDNSGVSVDKMPSSWSETTPAYLPTRELLTIYPNFVSVYESHYLNFEETWRDTCILLGAPVQRGPKQERIQTLLKPLEDAMGGKIELDRSGRFYLSTADGRMEMPLVAEGFRKLGMLAQLISTGVLLDGGYLFWDEPEANLNPKLVQRVAKSILAVCSGGVQVFIATHSLFLLRELEILLSSHQFKAALETRFIGLHSTRNGVSVQQGTTVDEIGDIAALDEALRQSDRFLAEK